MRSIRRRSWRHWGVCGLMLALVGLSHTTAVAHLGIIRLGRESAGTMHANARMGTAVASGDFDGDGFADLASAAMATVGNAPQAGMVVANYGCRTGLNHSAADGFTQDSLGRNSSANDRFGAALAVGDFNADGKDDLAIGTPGDVNSRGSIMVIRGSHAGLLGVGTYIDQSSFSGQNNDGDQFGAALATGDFDGDGYDDLAVGIPGKDVGIFTSAMANAGAVRIIFGSESGLTVGGSRLITEDDLDWGAAEDAGFGSSLAAGDIDNDDFVDLVVGASLREVFNRPNAGTVAVLYGSAFGPSLVENEQITQLNVGGANTENDRFGMTLAVGDADGDGYADVAIGTPLRDFSANAADVGRVYLAYGTSNGLSLSNVDIIDGVDTIGATPNDKFGTALAFGDYTGDGRDELAVSVPNRALQPGIGGNVQAQAGLIVMYVGTSSGVQLSDPIYKSQNHLFEFPEANDHFGMALAFGRFAGGSRAGLAVGSPDEDFDPNPNTTPTALVDSGAVYIDLGSRQVQGIRSRVSMIAGCDGDILFSQKPFEEHYLASTTKIMTLLLACEAVDSGSLDLTDEYVFPVLFTNDGDNGGTVGGSMANLCPGERITVLNLMYATMLVSGNDAAFGLADMVVNKNQVCNDTDCTDISTFRSQMIARALQLGMNDTTFGNPSGAGLGQWASNNRSTPYDMAILSHTAMQNALFRQVVGTGSYNLVRDVDPGMCVNVGTITPLSTLAFALPGGESPDFPMFAGSGVKGGSGAGAGRSTIASADLLSGRIFALVYGELTREQMKTDAIAMLTLASNVYCQPDILLPPPPPSPPGFVKELTNVPMHTHHGGHLPFPIMAEPSKPVIVRVAPSAGSPDVAGQLRLERNIEINLPPGDRCVQSIAPFVSHDGIRVCNRGQSRSTFTITFGGALFNQTAVLAPGQCLSIPPYASPTPLPSVELVIVNLDAESIAVLEITERGLAYDLNLHGGAAYEVRLTMCRSDGEDSVHVNLFGNDPNPDAAVDVIVAQTIDTDPNCDGTLDANDVDAFVRALLDPALFRAAYPSCYYAAGDYNDDGQVDAGDIQIFVAHAFGD